MKILKLKLKNIRSYKEAEFEFPNGSILLSGDIGSGKTSLLLAIEYGLFGLQPGQKGSSLMANGEDSAEVSLELEINGKPVLIERSMRRSSKSISQEESSITIEGVKTEYSVTELKIKILELLNYPIDFLKKTNLLYRYTVYCPQEEMKSIITEDPESRLDIIRHIFGIDKYKKIRDNLQVLISRMREKSKSVQGEIKDIDEIKTRVLLKKDRNVLLAKNLVEFTDRLGATRLLRERSESEIASLTAKIKEKERFEKEIEKTNFMLSTKREQMAKEIRNLDLFEKKIQEAKQLFSEEDLAMVNEQISSKNILMDRLNKQYVESLTKKKSLMLRKQEEIGKKDRIFSIEFCPTCLQDVSTVHKHNILNDSESKLVKIEKEISELSFQEAEFSREIAKENNLLKDLNEKKLGLERTKVRLEEAKLASEAVQAAHKMRETLETDIQFLESHLLNMKKSVFEFSKYEGQFKLKEGELKHFLEIEKRIEIEIATIKKETELIEKEISDFIKTIAEKEMKREKMIYLLELEKWLSEDFSAMTSFTERSILYKLREEFAKLFNRWFSLLTNDSFYARLDENFTPVITQGEFELDYSFLSGGERTAVALSYRLALNQLINSIFSKINTKDIIILDEPTDGFSSHQLDKVRDILQELQVSQLIIVSHEQKIEGFVNNVLRVKKDRGISVLN